MDGHAANARDRAGFRTERAGHDACDSAAMTLLMMFALIAPGKWDCGIVALVTRVFDGDTVDVGGLGRVRLLGIDAPEIGGPFERPAPFALEARDELQSLVLHRWARFDCDGDANDAYGRRLAYMTLETGEFINGRLVRDGLARVSARRRLQRWDELRQAEADAQMRRRGMWGDRPRVPPESYRLRRRR
jgi:micrococcal nuclease